MVMSQALEDLKQEHDAVLFALDILERMVARVDAGQPVDPQQIGSLLAFLHEFADTCHHGKEEGLLMPALLDAGIARDAEPLRRMLDEHTQGRELVQRMRAAALPMLRGPAFTATARAYASLLRSHIAHEQEVLFPLAEARLSTAQLDNLFDAFAIHESEVIGPGRHEALHEMLGELGEKYASAATRAAPAHPSSAGTDSRARGQPSVW
jgi:hemerythrin-like domain-containing protein